MRYQKVLKVPKSIPYLSIRFDVGADFTWIFIAFPSGILIGRPFKTIHSGPQSHEPAISKIKEAQKMYSLESRYFLESTEICHIPLLCFLRNKGSDYAVIGPTIAKNSASMNVRKLYNDRFDSKKAAEVGLDASLKASIVPGDTIIDLRNLVRDYYYFKDLQSVAVLKLHAELKVSFPAHLNVLNGVTTQTSLELLEAYSLAADMFVTPKDELMGTIRNTARLGETYALARYDAICTAAKDAVVLGRALLSNVLRIRLYIGMYREYQAYLDSILEELHQAIGRLEGAPDCDRISFIQILHGVGFLSAAILIVEMGSFDLSSLPKKLYAYFELDPGVNDSGKFHRDRVHMPKRGSSLARCILHMVAISNLKVDKATKTPMSPVVYDYYTRKYASKKKSVVVRVVMYKICSTVFATLRDNKPFEFIASEKHREHYTVEHLESMNTVA